MWWTNSWVDRFFTDRFDSEHEIPAAMKRSSALAYGLAATGALNWIIALVMIGGSSPMQLQGGLLSGMVGSTAILVAVIAHRSDRMIFVLLWEKRREQKEEMRRLDAADL